MLPLPVLSCSSLLRSGTQRLGRMPGEMLKDSFIRAAEEFFELASRWA